MKKNIISLVWVVIMSAGATAQDTLQIRWPLSTYFSYQWPPSYYDDFDTFRTELIFRGSNIFTKDIAYYMFTEDTLTIYGVAACMMSEMDHHGNISGHVLDTTYRDVYDFLRVYEAGNGELIPLGEVKVHMHETPVAYYMNWNAYQQYVGSFMQPILPMYECYFTSPVTLADSFYVGRHLHAHRHAYVDMYTATTMEIFHVRTNAYYSDDKITQPEAHLTNLPPPGESAYDTLYYTWVYYNEDNYHSEFLRGIPLMFPILEPGSGGVDTIFVGNDTIAMGDTLIVCDTTIIGGDTIVNYDTILAIVQPDMLQRLTGVMPNPAVGTAKVVSSFGIDMVKVYNATGTKVYDSPATGFYHNLDVSRWPSGTYLVRIHTPQGIATKRLVVSR